MTAVYNYLKNWMFYLLEKLGFIGKEATLVLLGLDNAGKTTLQYKLKTGKLQGFVPTERAKEEMIQLAGLTIRCWDLGGHQPARHLWKKYATAADGIVFMVDAADRDRIAEARTELHALLADPNIYAPAATATAAAAATATAAAPAAAAPAAVAVATPIVILANKTDIKDSMERDELMKELALPAASPHCQLFLVSIVKEAGYVEAFQWMAKQIP